MSFSSFAPLARATLASSSRVGLDFTRPAVRAVRAGAAAAAYSPRFVSTSSPASSPSPSSSSSAASSSSSSSSAGPDAALPVLRWNPHPSEPFARARSPVGHSDRAPTHTLTVMSTNNNVLLTFTDQTGPLFPTITAGTDKVFRKANRSTYEAAHQAMLKMIAKILTASRAFAAQGNRMHLRIAFKGFFGQGREAVNGAIQSSEGDEIRPLITMIEDRTPIKIGGTRARKPRRL